MNLPTTNLYIDDLRNALGESSYDLEELVRSGKVNPEGIDTNYLVSPSVDDVFNPPFHLNDFRNYDHDVLYSKFIIVSVSLYLIGSDFYFEAEIKNTGNTSGTRDVTFILDGDDTTNGVYGDITGVESVYLASGQSTTVTPFTSIEIDNNFNFPPSYTENKWEDYEVTGIVDIQNEPLEDRRKLWVYEWANNYHSIYPVFDTGLRRAVGRLAHVIRDDKHQNGKIEPLYQGSVWAAYYKPTYTNSWDDWWVGHSKEYTAGKIWIWILGQPLVLKYHLMYIHYAHIRFDVSSVTNDVSEARIYINKLGRNGRKLTAHEVDGTLPVDLHDENNYPGYNGVVAYDYYGNVGKQLSINHSKSDDQNVSMILGQDARDQIKNQNYFDIFVLPKNNSDVVNDPSSMSGGKEEKDKLIVINLRVSEST
jgi:hypothetical protein